MNNDRKDFEAWYVQSRGVDPVNGEAMSEETMLGLLKRNPDNDNRYWPDVQELWELWEARFGVIAAAAPEPEAVKPGLYAIRHIDNWCGERDVRTSLATYDKDGKWRYDENGAPVLEYAGDRLLNAWPLDHVGGEALTYVAGVTAAVLAIRSIMDQFREEHSEPEPAPGTSGMSEQDLATWHVMYRLEQAVRELKEGNLVPLPPAWLNQEEDNG